MRVSTARPWSVQEVNGVRSWGLFLLLLLLSSCCFRSDTLLSCSFLFLLFFCKQTPCAPSLHAPPLPLHPNSVRVSVPARERAARSRSEHRRARARQTPTGLAPAQWGQRRGLYRKHVVNKVWFKVCTRVCLNVKTGGYCACVSALTSNRLSSEIL